ncbi:MAG: VPLPA-CTERM sorting domain-containing protein [Candidatus Thiodiazotropha sp. 6PLUC9]
MKMLTIRSVALLAILLILSLGANAASYDAGSFSDLGDTYATPQPTGNFLDSYHFTVDTPLLDIAIGGSHEGMFQDDLLLTNLNTNEQYHLGTSFLETFSLSAGDYIFTISGFALNAIDPKMSSDYDLTMSAVPLPAAAWLFGSALIGFVSFARRRSV